MKTNYPRISAGYLGAMCGEYRRMVLGISQQEIANQMDVSRELVSKFERGRICNGTVFMWYIKNGIFDWVPVERWNGWDGFMVSIPNVRSE